MLNLLAIDDDDLVLQSIRMCIPDTWRVTAVHSLKEIPLKQKYDAAFVDMHLTGNLSEAEGIKVIESLNISHPHLEIVAMSGDLNRDLMESCLKAGASRFLAKPLSVDEVLLTLEKIEAHILLQNASSRSQSNTIGLIGKSDAIKSIKKQIAALKGEKGPILIEGESGTGKEVVSALLHAQENTGPFIRVNIAAIPDNLFESELFGHVKGAFTGAEQNKMGLAEAAHNGNLFLDEIEALSLPLQVKLLRFLETGEVRRVGSDKSMIVNTRVIVATNRNLEDMVKNKEFREDLLWRINGKKITLPPLRDRREDIEPLAEYFIAQDSVRKKQISDDAINTLKSYSWPGNVRELKRLIEQLIVQSPLPIIRAEDVLKILNPKTETDTLQGYIDYSKGLTELTKEFEKSVIISCLETYKDIDQACNVLKVSRSNLYKKIKDYQIDWKD